MGAKWMKADLNWTQWICNSEYLGTKRPREGRLGMDAKDPRLKVQESEPMKGKGCPDIKHMLWNRWLWNKWNAHWTEM